MYEYQLVVNNAVLDSTGINADGFPYSVYLCYDDDGVYTRTATITETPLGGSLIFTNEAVRPTLYGEDYEMAKPVGQWEKGKQCPICGDWFPESEFMKVRGKSLCLPNKCYMEVRPK